MNLGHVAQWKRRDEGQTLLQTVGLHVTPRQEVPMGLRKQRLKDETPETLSTLSPKEGNAKSRLRSFASLAGLHCDHVLTPGPPLCLFSLEERF
jgi:hypothetical protein